MKALSPILFFRGDSNVRFNAHSRWHLQHLAENKHVKFTSKKGQKCARAAPYGGGFIPLMAPLGGVYQKLR